MLDARPMRRLLLCATVLLALTAGAGVAMAQSATRHIEINGRKATAKDLATIAEIERATGQPARDGKYWYDRKTGALGVWGGPTVTFLAPNLPLGGPLPANASGGGDGSLTGVFINGRELHPADVQALAGMLGTPIVPGRWWVDARGNAGQEGGPAIMNLVQLAQQNGRSYYKSDGKGGSAFVSKGCTAVHGSSGSGESKRDHSYYVGCD